MHVAGLMLHAMREAAAGHPDLKQIFAGNYKFSAAAGVDKFYFERGFKISQKTCVASTKSPGSKVRRSA